MNNYKYTFNPKAYLTAKNIAFKESGSQLITKCFFNNCDADNKSTEGHLYISTSRSQFHCKKCDAKGNLFTLAEHFGDAKRSLFENGFVINNSPNQNYIQNDKAFDAALVKQCYSALSPENRVYLNNRCIDDKIITQFKLGEGQFYRVNWITIPYQDISGNFVCFKLRRIGEKETQSRYAFYPTKKLGIFNLPVFNTNPKQLIITEGELDTLVLLANGFSAISLATGAKSILHNSEIDLFRNIPEIVITYDADVTGREGAVKLAKQLVNITQIKVIDISLLCETGDKDITDIFKKGKTAQELQLLINQTPVYNITHTLLKNSELKTSSEKADSVCDDARKFLTPCVQDDFSEKLKALCDSALVHFPQLWQTIELCLSIILQLRIADINNPFALVLIGRPASSKTTVLSLFKDMPDLCYYTDSFSPASFVSHHASQKSEALEKVDMLPKIKDKVLITPELATLFTKNEDRLTDTFGTLTRVLDGQGLMVDSGVHGQRGYSGEYMFTWLGASTPIRESIWEVMGNMGARIFFYNIPELNHDDPEKLLETINSKVSYSEKINDCKSKIQDFFNLFLSIDKIIWNANKDDRNTLLQIMQYGQLLAKLRGVITYFDKENLQDANVLSEDPQRICRLLINLAKGYAVLNGRNYIVFGDIGIIKTIVLNSCPDRRRKIINAFIDRKTTILNISEVQAILHCSDKTATKYMEIFNILEISEFQKGACTYPAIIELKPEYRFILGL